MQKKYGVTLQKTVFLKFFSTESTLSFAYLRFRNSS